MKKLNLLPVIFSIMAILSLTGCKKDDEVPFQSETVFTPLQTGLGTGSGWIMGASLHAPTGILYIYQERAGGKGFYIHAYNSKKKSYATVYEFTDVAWSNSNGSEGARIRVDGNNLWICGGFTNNRVICLKGLDQGTPVFDKQINVTSPYDISFTPSTVYVLSSSKGIVAVERSNNTAKELPFAPGDPDVSHGSSIISVQYNGQTAFALIRSKRLELRSLTNTLIKAVNIPDLSLLQKDENNRIYLMVTDKIIRFSADLETKEEFAAPSARPSDGRAGFDLKREGNHIFIIYKDSDKLSSINISN